MPTANHSAITHPIRSAGAWDTVASADRTTEQLALHLRVLMLATIVLVMAGTLLPIHTAFGSPAHSLYSENRTTNVMVALLTLLPLWGVVFVNRRRTALGWTLGSIAIASSWALGAVAVTVMEVRVPGTFGDPLLMDGRGGGLRDPSLAGDPGYFIGFYAMVSAVIAGSATVGLGLATARRGHRRASVEGRQWILGAIASALLSVGFMLPLPGDDVGFVDRNLQTGDPFISVAWLVVASSFGVVGIIGFAARTWAGLGAVVATMIPAAWLYAVSSFGLDNPGGPGPSLLKSSALHHLVGAALCAQAIAITVTIVRQPTVARATGRSAAHASFPEPLSERPWERSRPIGASTEGPTMSVIVATRDRPEMLRRCVDSLLACRHDSFEVIVVDQSEQAASLPDDPRLTYLQTATSGKSAGLNLGLEAARGDVFAFTDDDCVVPDDWLDKGTAVLARHPEVDVVFGDLEPIDHDVAAVFVPSANFGRFRVVSSSRHAHRRGGAGANMFARREVFDRIGRYDELIGPGSAFAACEEYDIYYRALAAGSSVAFVPDLVTTHWGARPYGDGSGRMLKRMYAYGEGAVIGKHLRLGDPRMLLVLAHITVEDITVAAGNIVRSHRLAGLGTMAYKWRGIFAGLLTPVDRRERVFGR